MITIEQAVEDTLSNLTEQEHRLGLEVETLRPGAAKALEAFEDQLGRVLPPVLRAFLATNAHRHRFDGYQCLDLDEIVVARTNLRGLRWDWATDLVPVAAADDGELLCVNLHPSIDTLQQVNLATSQCRSMRYHDVGHLLIEQLKHLRAHKGETDGREHIVLYTLDELPEALTRALPVDARPRRCVFWAARESSPVVKALMAAIPEPEVDYVGEGMAVAKLVAEIAGRTAQSAPILRPQAMGARDRKYSIGFHAGDAAEVRTFVESQDCTVHGINKLLRDILVYDIVQEDGRSSENPLMRQGTSNYRPWKAYNLATANDCPPLYGEYGFDCAGEIGAVNVIPPRGVLRIELQSPASRFGLTNGRPIRSSFLQERGDELGFEFINHADDDGAGPLRAAFRKAQNIGELGTLLQKRGDLEEIAQRFAEPARRALQGLSATYAVRSPFCTLYGLVALLAVEGSDASADLLRTIAPRLMRATRTSAVVNPIRNISYFLSLFGTNDAMTELEAELRHIESGRQRRCEAAQLAELQGFPIKDRVDFHAIARLTNPDSLAHSRPEHHVLTVDLCPGAFDDWKVEIAKPDGGLVVSIRRGQSAVHNEFPELYSLFDLPAWLADVTVKTGWQFDAEHANVRFGRYKKARKVLVNWIVSEL